MPWITWGSGEGELVFFRFAKSMRRLRYSPVKRYLLAMDRFGEDHERTEQLRGEALAWVQEELAATQTELFELEFNHPELTEQEGEDSDDVPRER